MNFDLHYTYPDFTLDAAFSLSRGCLAILGPSGSGKTTVLNLIAGLLPHTPPPLPPRTRIGYLFQDGALFPNMTVAGNVACGLGVHVRKTDPRITEILQKLRISHLADRFPHQLSAGQKQRAALARALVYHPQVLLLDEPFHALNPELKQELWQELKALLQTFDGITILVTHDPFEAQFFSDQILVLDQGQVVCCGETWCTPLEKSEGIYADAAATSFPKPLPVIQAVSEAMCTLGSAGRGVHSASLAASRTVFQCRLMLSTLFHAAGPEQVVFTSNATEALNLLIKGVFLPGDHVITTAMEHNSVLRPLYELADQKDGITLTILPCEADGTLSLTRLEAAVTPQTRAFLCTHASNVTGICNDISAIGALCRRHGILFFLDAAQTAGVFPIHMEEDHIAALAFTGHKSLLGPQGVGGLCLHPSLRLRPLKTGGSGIHSFSRQHPAGLPEALEAGTLNVHGIAGLLAGLRFLTDTGPDRIRSREAQLWRCFYEKIKDLPGIRIYGNLSYEVPRAPILSLNVGDLNSALVSDRLAQQYGIATRAGAHCAPLMHAHFHTEEQGMVRFSFSYRNTQAELDTIAEALRSLLSCV